MPNLRVKACVLLLAILSSLPLSASAEEVLAGAKAALEACKDTTTFRQYQAAAAIPIFNDLIRGLEENIQHERDIEREVQVVNAAKLHEWGEKLVDAKETRRQLFEVYKENGGAASSIDGIPVLQNPCLRANEAVNSQVSAAAVASASTVRGDQHFLEVSNVASGERVVVPADPTCMPEMPPAAQRAKTTGDTTVRIRVDAEGRVTEAIVLKTSGPTREHRMLDNAAKSAFASCPMQLSSGQFDVVFKWRL